MFKIGDEVVHNMFSFGKGNIIEVDEKKKEIKVKWEITPSFTYNGGINPCWIDFNKVKLCENSILLFDGFKSHEIFQLFHNDFDLSGTGYYSHGNYYLARVTFKYYTIDLLTKAVECHTGMLQKKGNSFEEAYDLLDKLFCKYLKENNLELVFTTVDCFDICIIKNKNINLKDII